LQKPKARGFDIHHLINTQDSAVSLLRTLR
jgi:hypothetical protein